VPLEARSLIDFCVTAERTENDALRVGIASFDDDSQLPIFERWLLSGGMAKLASRVGFET